MSEYTVLKKGIFDSVRADFPFAEQYIIARKDDKKLLLVRIFNPLDKTVDGVKVSVKTYDKDGQLVSEDMYSYVLTCAGMSRAPLPQEIQIDEKAVSCEVEVKTVAAGGDTFVASGKRVRPIYDDAFSQKSDVAGVAKKERTQSTVVEKPGRLLLFVVACFMLVVMLVTMFALNEYVKTHDEFSISNVEYRFLNPAERDGSIVVTGYNGTARNIVIPEQIEDHAVVAIDDGAFAYNGNVRSITIEANVSVAKNAFSNCYMLEKVTMKNPLGIGAGAFDSCVNLKSVEIENSSNIKHIFADTFKGCGALKSFDIPQSVMSIADSAFEGCFSLESISFPSQLRTIGNYVFRNCSALKKIDIPSSVVNMGWEVFSGCDAVTEMSFSRSYGGAFYSLFGDEWSVSPALAKITYKGDAVEPWMFSNLNVQTISLPNVTKIDEYAFSNCSLLESVSLSKNLTHIGSSAFANCQNLRQVNIPQGVNHIGSSAFYCCYNLESVSLPYSIMSIEDYTFYNCSRLRDLILPDTIQYIGSSAFESCSSLTKLIVPDRVERIEANALIGCDSLEELSLPRMSGSLVEVFGGSDYNQSYVVPYSLKKVTVKSETIASYAFAYLSWLEQVSIPNATSIGEYAFSQCSSIANIELSQDLQTIGEYAFEQCTSLTEIAIPAGVTRIENYTFSNCNSLMYVDTIADLTYIGENAFSNCSRLASINLGNALEELGASAFSNCTSLVAISLPATVTTIGDNAFANCYSLSQIELLEGLVLIGESAFSNCSSLSRIDLPEGVESLGSNLFSGCTTLASLTIPSTVQNADFGMLSGCNSLEELAMPQVFGNYLANIFGGGSYSDNYYFVPFSLKNVRITNSNIPDYAIPDYAFYQCSSLESVAIDSANHIGENAFSDCYALNNITLPARITSIENGTFSSCSSLQSIDMPANLTYIGEGAFANCSSLASINLGNALVGLGSSAFSNCTSLAEVSLPATVTTIDNSAFANCSSLASINLGNALVELGSYAFSNCTSLAEVSLPSTVTTIGNNAFENCTSLTSFTIPYSATSVGVGVLSGCSALEELTMPQVFGGHLVYVFGSYNGYVDNFLIPSNLKTVRVTGTDVAGYAFYYCSIELVEIDNVTNIGENAFYGSSIKNIDLPRSLQSIGRGAFSYCSSLQSVVLPQGIAYLDEYVFMGCSSLRSVVLPQSLSDIGYNAFWECYNLYEIYNLSSLPLSVGSYDYGYVAYYAKVIHTSLDEDPAMVVTTDENVELIRIGDQYYATKYVGNEAELTLADLHYDGITVSSYSIERGFLANNYSVAYLGILPQARLMSESFANCHSLTSVDLTDSMALEIPYGCFNNCTALQTVQLPSLDSIGSNAFSNCSSLTSVNIPDGVDIRSYAFAWCYSLESVVLPQNVTLDYGVFMDCYNLFEVYNLSGLDLRDWNSTGYAGAYALKIYDNTSELSQVVKFKDGQGFKYALCDGKAHLYGFDGDEHAYYNVDSTVVYNNNSYPCSIRKGAFANFPYNKNVIMSKQVTFDDESYKVLDHSPNIYFRGTQSEWENIFTYDYTWWNSLYFQADCVHEDGNKWAMINGEIVTYPSFDSAITKEATCTEEGEEERTCRYCGEKFYSSIPTTSHSYVDTVIEQPTCTEEGTLKHVCSVCGDEIYEAIRPSGRHNIVDGTCTECGVRVIEVTQENISDCFFVDTDPEYPFEWRDGVLVSTNQGCPNTRSSITLTARENYQISIIYTVSSENGYDYLTIEANGTEIVRVAGADMFEETISVNVLSGNELTFAYTKDGSADHGEDTGKILTIYIYERS